MNLNRSMDKLNGNLAERTSLLEEEMQVITHPGNGINGISNHSDINCNKGKERIAISVRNICKNYGKAEILKNLSMTVRQSSIYALLGPSGCGKTTLLSSIVGLKNLTSGSIKIFGYNAKDPKVGIPGNRIGFQPQDIGLFRELSIYEALQYFGRIAGMPFSEIDTKIAFFINLLNLPKKSRRIWSLSDGQKRRVSFAASLIHGPELLILDEPTVGVDALLRECIWDHLVNLATKFGTTIVITTHYIEEANQANRIGIMRNGRILAEDSPENLCSIYKETNLQKIVINLCIQDDKKMTIEDGYVTPAIKQNLELEEDDSEMAPPEPWKKGTKKFIRLMALTKRNLIRLRMNLPFILFFLFIPALATILFGYTIGGDIKGIKVGFVNLEEGYKTCQNITFPDSGEDDSDEECKTEHISCKFLRDFNSVNVKLSEYETEDEALADTEVGKIWAYFVIPKKFSSKLYGQYLGLADSKKNRILVRADMTSQPVSFTLQKVFFNQMTEFAKKMSEKCTGEEYKSLEDNILKIGEPVYGSMDRTFQEYAMPSVLVVIIFYMAITLSGLVLILEKKQGMYERSLVTGVTKSEIILSHLFCQYIIMLLQICLSFVFALILFKMQILGSTIGVLFLIVIQGTIGMLLGFIMSSVCSNETSVMQLTIGIMVPILLLSGMIWPLEGQPEFLSYISYINPTTIASESMRSMINRGWTFEHERVWIGYATSLGWIAALSILLFILTRFKN